MFTEIARTAQNALEPSFKHSLSYNCESLKDLGQSDLEVKKGFQ
jgi:Uri superfamily endonuclease